MILLTPPRLQRGVRCFFVYNKEYNQHYTQISLSSAQSLGLHQTKGDSSFYFAEVFAFAFSVAFSVERLLAACCTLATSVFIFSASDL